MANTPNKNENKKNTKDTQAQTAAPQPEQESWIYGWLKKYGHWVITPFFLIMSVLFMLIALKLGTYFDIFNSLVFFVTAWLAVPPVRRGLGKLINKKIDYKVLVPIWLIAASFNFIVHFLIDKPGMEAHEKKLAESAEIQAAKLPPVLAAARSGIYWGFIDAAGNWQIPAKYDEVKDFAKGKAYAIKDGKPVIIDILGQETPTDKPVTSGESKPYFDLIPFAADGRMGFKDSLNAIKIPPRFDAVREFVYE